MHAYDRYLSSLGYLAIIERYIARHAQGRPCAFPLEELLVKRERLVRDVAKDVPTTLEGCIVKLNRSFRCLAPRGDLHEEWERTAKRTLRPALYALRAFRKNRRLRRGHTEAVTLLRRAAAAIPEDNPGLKAVHARTAVEGALGWLI